MNCRRIEVGRRGVAIEVKSKPSAQAGDKKRARAAGSNGTPAGGRRPVAAPPEPAPLPHEDAARLLLITRQVPAVLWTTDADLRFTSSTGAGLAHLNMQGFELNKTSLYEFFHTDDPKFPAIAAHREALKGSSVTYQLDWDGRAYNSHVEPLRDAQQHIVGVVGVALDVTERALMQEMLRFSEQRYRDLIENANDIIYTHDLEGNFTSINKAASASTGYTREEILRMNIADVVAPGQFASGAAATRDKIAGLATRNPYELEITAKDGRRLVFEVNTRLVYQNGKPCAVQGIARDITDRKQAEQALRESESNLRIQTAYLEQLFQSAPEGIVALDQKGCVVRANPEFCRVFGYSNEEMRGRFIDDLIVPPQKAAEAADLTREITSGQAFNVETVRRRKNGALVEVSILGAPVNLQSGQIGRYLIYRDITARKRAEQLQSALYRIAERANAAEDLEQFYAATHGIVGELMYARNFYIALYDGETGKLSFPYFVDEEDPEPPEAQNLGRGLTAYVVRTGEPLLASPEKFAELVAAGEVETVGADSIDWLGVPLKLADRTFGALVIQSYTKTVRFGEEEKEILTFVSQHVASAIEHKRNQEALRRSENRYRTMVQSAVHGIYRASADGRFLDVNPALAAMLGYDSPEELLALNIDRDVYADPEDRTRFLQRMQNAERLEDAETRWRRKDGRTITVRLSGRVVLDGSGRVQANEMIAEDVTERRALEEQLQQSQKMEAVGRLAGGVAHDFNNLLTVIKGYTELLLNDIAETDPMRNDMEEVRKAADRAVALTRQLLAFSRRQVLAPKVLDLNGVVANMERLLRRLVGEDVEIRLSLAPDLGRVKADPGQLEQVIMNLAVNARDAMPHGGRLTIETSNVQLDQTYSREHAIVNPGPYVLLAVSDTGHGMDPDTCSRVFEPFFTTKEQGKGTGLGLSTVYGIIKQSGGYVWAYSEPGEGATFKVYLPRIEAAAEAAAPRSLQEDPYRGTETVLLVEDEDGVRALVKHVLQKHGYNVIESRHGGEALMVCERYEATIDLLLTDVVLEQMNGRELARRLSPLRPQMKVLYISGYTEEAIVHHGVLDPGTAFLQKPFTTAALAAKVREVLDGSV